MSGPFRLGVAFDFPEEGWRSMDFCAEMLLTELEELQEQVTAERICPPFRKRFGLLPLPKGLSFNADRILNRFRSYPQYLAPLAKNYDAFHIVDHSYSQLVHVLPSARTGIYCHDLDAFRSILEPEREPRPYWFRRLVRKQLDGFRKAAIIFYSTQGMYNEITRLKVVDPSKLVQAPLGLGKEFVANPPESGEVDSPVPKGRPFILHVGSCVQRKRIDVLLNVFAGLRKTLPDLILLQIGGEWSPSQREQISNMGIESHLIQVRGVERSYIASHYRRASLVLLTSEAEGFGFPVIEALACGAPILISDIPVLREVAGAAASYAPVADIDTWVTSASQVLADPSSSPAKETRLERAKPYSWKRHTAIIVEAYRKLLGTV